MTITTGSIFSRWTHLATLMVGLVLMLATPAAFAASAVATVSQNVVAVGDAFQLTITVDDSVDSDALDLSPLSTDFIYGRPSVSNSTSIINGSMSRKTEWRVAVAAKQTGTYTLPSLDVDGMKTEPITIQVVNAGEKGNALDENAVKLTASIDRAKGYIGETFNYRVRLMIGTQLDSPTLYPPQGEGLEVKQVGEDVQAEAVLNGRRYVVISRLYQITPTQAGNIDLQGAVFSGAEVKNSGWGSSLGVPIQREAESLTLEVLDKPADYQGLWLPTPSLMLAQSWQPDSLDGRLDVEVGEPINREITLKIKNIEQSAMPDLSLNYPPSVRVYADKAEYSRDGDYTVMTVKQVIIPRDAEDITLPALSINWFNTQSGQSQTSELEGLSLTVKPGTAAPAVTAPAPTVADSGITPPTESLSGSTTVVTSAGFWPWLTGLFALLWLVTLVLYLRKGSDQPAAAEGKNLSPTGPSGLEAVKAAVSANDAVKVAAAMRQWDRTTLPDALRRDIEQEVDAMMASRYSPAATSWRNDTLLALLKKAGEVKASGRKASALSELA